MKGKIIVIDGMDGTGKTTQSRLLYENLKNKGLKVKLFSFPNYDEYSSYFVKKYLEEGYCRDIENDIPILHDIFYGIDRAITYYKNIKEFYEDGYIIILARYIISNLIYSLHNYNDFPSKGKYCTILHSFENRILNIPQADINIILYSEPDVNTAMIDKRSIIEGTKPDLNENLEFQTKVFENVKSIDCDYYTYKLNFGDIEKILIHDDHKKVYSREFIHEEIIKIIEKYI